MAADAGSGDLSDANSHLTVRAMDSLPPLPAIALRVVQVVQNPDSSAADLATVVSADPGLSAQFLRVANSAAYRRSREVSSVKDALVLMGFSQARNLAIGGAIATAFPPDALHALFRIETFWRHSLAVAFQAGRIAERTKSVDVATAFTAGVLHDIGRLAMFHADPSGLDQAVAQHLKREEALEDVELAVLGYDHSAVGGRLAARWGLPEDVSEAISRHHEPDLDPSTLPGVISAADQFCIAAGFHSGVEHPAPLGTHPAPMSPEIEKLHGEVNGLTAMIRGASVGVAEAPAT
jgi:putative nucleotidyltransferase with HDIG domain